MRKRLSWLLLVLLLAAGCTRPAEVPQRIGEEPDAPAEEIITLRFGYGGNLNPTAVDVLVSAFQQQNPRFRVEKELTNLRQFDRMPDMINHVKNRKFDLLDGSHWAWSGDYNVLFEQLDPYVSRGQLDLQPCGGSDQSAVHGGKLWALPLTRVPIVLVANRALLEASGLKVPEQGWTWEQFRTSAAALTAGEGEAKVWGLAANSLPFLVNSWVEERTGQPVWDSDPAVIGQAMAFFHGMAVTDRSLYPETGYDRGVARVDPLAMVRSGRAAMAIERWDVMGQGSDDLVVLPFPAHDPARRVSPSAFTYIAMAIGTTRPDDAWTFIQFALSPAAGEALATAGLLPACPTEAARAAWMRRAPAPQPATETFFTSRWTAVLASPTRPAVGYSTLMSQMLYRLVNGRVTPEDALADYQNLKDDTMGIFQKYGG